MKKILISTGAVFLSLNLHAEVLKKSFPAEKLKDVNLANSVGSVTVLRTSDGKANLTADVKSDLQNCNLKIGQKGTQISAFARGKSNSPFSKLKCEINWTIELPENVNLKMKLGTGDVKVEDLAGKVDLKLGVGNVSLNSNVERLTAGIGSGNINALNLTGNSDIKIGAGKIDVAYSALPEKGYLKIKAGKGHANVSLPKAAKINTIFKSGMGKKESDIANDPSSKFKLDFTSGMGNLTVKGT